MMKHAVMLGQLPEVMRVFYHLWRLLPRACAYFGGDRNLLANPSMFQNTLVVRLSLGLGPLSKQKKA